MRGKTVVITGGTSGIGEIAAVTLARMGARIVLIARDKIRSDAILARLREYAPGIAHTVHFADLLRALGYPVDAFVAGIKTCEHHPPACGPGSRLRQAAAEGVSETGVERDRVPLPISYA